MRRRIIIGSVAAGFLLGSVFTVARVDLTWTAHGATGFPAQFQVSVPVGGTFYDLRGHALTKLVPEPIVLLNPPTLKSWAKRSLSRFLGRRVPNARRPIAWPITSAQAKVINQWASPGLLVGKVFSTEPVAGISSIALRSLEATAGKKAELVRVTTRPQFPPRLQIVLNGPPRRVVALRLSWQRALVAALPPNASAVAVRGDGQIEAVAGSSDNPALPFAAEPVHQALLPCLWAQSRPASYILHSMSQAASADRSWSPSRPWSYTRIRTALDRLELPQSPWPEVVPSILPSSGTVSPIKLFNQGQGLWASPLSVARAYLPFITGGPIPQLTVRVQPNALKRVRQPDQASKPGWRQVQAVLPTMNVGGTPVTSWDPFPYHYAVGLTIIGGQPVVVVADGLRTSAQWESVLAALVRASGKGAGFSGANIAAR